MIGIGVDCVLHGCEMQPGVGSEHQQPGPAPTKIADIFRHRIGRESEMAPEPWKNTKNRKSSGPAAGADAMVA